MRCTISKMAKLGLSVLGGVLLLGAQASADIIYLNTGGVVKGTIVREADDIVFVRLDSGVTTEVDRANIDRIERGGTPEEIYRKKAAEIDPVSADAHYELGAWLRSINLPVLADEEFNKTIILNPDHPDARAALGYVKRGATWVPKEQWIGGTGGEDSPDVRRSGDEDSPDVRKVPESPGLSSLPAQTRQSIRKVVSVDPAQRAKAWEAIAPLQDSVRAAAVAYVAQVGKAGARDLTRLYHRLGAAIPEYETEKWGRIKNAWRERWVTTRDSTLSVIFDLQVYPDENHGVVGQPKVNEKVDAVKEAWRYMDLLLARDVAAFAKTPPEEAARRLADIEAMEARQAEIASFLAREGAVAIDATVPAPATPVARCLLTYRAGRVDDAWKQAEGLSDWDKEIVRRLRRIRVDEYNAALVGQTPAVGKAPTAVEREQVRITNDYREMMGREPIEIHTALIAAARGHSEEMTALGYFEHESPVEENKTPGQRASKAGYPQGVSENISKGSPGPQDTFNSWYNSAPHHRNMLGAGHKAMGSGLNGDHWTQDYGPVGLLTR